jgi:hypothetical protein
MSKPHQQEPARNSQEPGQGGKKTYTMQDLLEATERILKEDNIGKKLPDSAIANLSKLLVKTSIKGDL